MPHMASGSLGARARKHFAVNGVPHAVVTEFKDGFVKVVNPDAAGSVFEDPEGNYFPWYVCTGVTLFFYCMQPNITL
jgi:hypothetical protein